MQFKPMDRLIVKSLNIPGLVTTGKTTLYFIREHPKNIIEATPDNPDQDDHVLINFFDILYAYDVETEFLKYEYNMERAL